MKNKIFIYIVMACIIAIHFLLFSCGAKTKTKTEVDTQVNQKSTTTTEAEQKKYDSLKISLEETAKKEFNQSSNETNKQENTRTTTTEVTETITNPAVNFRPAGSQGNYINDATGEIITRHTKIIMEEKFAAEQQKQIQTQINEEEKRKKELIAISEELDKKLETNNLQLETKLKKIIDNKVKKQWEPSLKLIFGVLSFIVLLLICLFSWLKYSSPFSWIFLIFKRKKNDENRP